MCTAITLNKSHFYFGRTLDYDISFGEKVVITPRNYKFDFRYEGASESHFAIIGMAIVVDGCPLYFDGMNEKGLCIAGLNFVGNAVYREVKDDCDGAINLPQFEFIPFILSRYKSVAEVKRALENIRILKEPFSDELVTAQLHWIIADGERCITVERVRGGMKIYDNPVGVLTNNPPFDMQMFNLNNYMTLSCKAPVNAFADGLRLQEYGRGMGALGLPGDISPQSRFVRAAFVKLNSVCDDLPVSCVNQFFHILGSVENQRGCCRLSDGKCEMTQYTCCCDADEGVYYYTTYSNHRISAVSLKSENLDGNKLIVYDLLKNEDIYSQNG